MRIIFFFLLIPINILYCQLNLPVNDSVQNFLFAKSTLGKPIIITENGIFEYLSDWEYTSFADNSFKKELDNLNQLNHANFFTIINSKELYIISNGAGPVFVYRDNTFKRIDNSSLHKNQFGGARFIYNNKIHIYGGYGFWSFKSFITFFDNNISQWDLLYNESKYTPPGRWKPIYNLINDKLYVLGGRPGLEGSFEQDESFSDVFYFDFIVDLIPTKNEKLQIMYGIDGQKILTRFHINVRNIFKHVMTCLFSYMCVYNLSIKFKLIKIIGHTFFGCLGSQ